MDIPVYELRIRDEDSEVDYIALVDLPAIEKDFIAFSKIPEHFVDTYNDYPKEASENAQTALNYAEEYGWGDCGTDVGKQRANQLAKREPISRDTIARMAAFERQRQNSDRKLGDGCGRLMWLAWGGDAGVEWASRKLQQIDKLKAAFAITNEDRRIISGPLMLADKLIFRTNDEMGNHYVKFSKETIQKIAIKYAKRGYQKNVNVMHDDQLKLEGVVLFESFITDAERGILPMKGYEDAADGSWFGSMYVENDEAWQAVKENKLKGFSVEGFFDYDKPKESAEQKLKKIIELLFTPITD